MVLRQAGIPIWMGLMLVPVVMLVAIYIMKSSASG